MPSHYCFFPECFYLSLSHTSHSFKIQLKDHLPYVEWSLSTPLHAQTHNTQNSSLPPTEMHSHVCLSYQTTSSLKAEIRLWNTAKDWITKDLWESNQCRGSSHQVCWYCTTTELSKIAGIVLIKLLLKNETVLSVTWNGIPTYYKN